jgi:hypothetical protein
VHPAAELKFFVVEAGEIVAGGELHGIVVGRKSLQNNFAGRLAATSATGNLREQLKRALGGAKIGKAERGVGSDDSNEGDTVNVMTFGDHLRADEDIEFALIERVESAFEIFASAHGIAIEASDAGLREHAVK